jgi:hypothetical protein
VNRGANDCVGFTNSVPSWFKDTRLQELRICDYRLSRSICGEFEWPQMCEHLSLVVLQPAQLENRVTSVDLLRRILGGG